MGSKCNQAASSQLNAAPLYGAPLLLTHGMTLRPHSVPPFGLVLLGAAALACARGSAPERSLHRQLIAEVLLAEVAALPDVADSGRLAVFMSDTTVSHDSASALFEAQWVSTWHVFAANGIDVPSAVEARFRNHFDLAAPPADPYAHLPRVYSVRELRRQGDSALTAVVGVPYYRCRYHFSLVAGAWRISREPPADCSIS